MLVFGYPTQQQKNRQKPLRSDLQHIVHENGYRQMDKEELQAMLTCKSGQPDYHKWLEAFCNRKYNSDFSREMTRSVTKHLEEFTYSHKN